MGVEGGTSSGWGWGRRHKWWVGVGEVQVVGGGGGGGTSSGWGWGRRYK